MVPEEEQVLDGSTTNEGEKIKFHNVDGGVMCMMDEGA